MGIQSRLHLRYLATRTPAPGIALAALILLFWQFLLPRYNITGIPLKYLGSPAGIWNTFIAFARHGYDGTTLGADILISLARVCIGFAIGATVAIIVGTLMGYYSFVEHLIGPILSFLRPIPALAFIPVVIIWLGIGETPKILVISFAAFVYSVLSVTAGIQNIPIQYLRVAQNFGLSGKDRFLHVVVPAALPFVVPGLRTAMALSWAVVVTAELIAAQNGLGHVVIDAANFFQINIVYVGITFIGLIGFCMDLIFRVCIGRVLHWTGK